MVLVLEISDRQHFCLVFLSYSRFLTSDLNYGSEACSDFVSGLWGVVFWHLLVCFMLSDIPVLSWALNSVQKVGQIRTLSSRPEMKLLLSCRAPSETEFGILGAWRRVSTAPSPQPLPDSITITATKNSTLQLFAVFSLCKNNQSQFMHI